jgi:hypothetical protein
VYRFILAQTYYISASNRADIGHSSKIFMGKTCQKHTN